MCDIDIEMAKIQTDLKWIKNSSATMQKDIGVIKHLLTQENERINKLNKTVYGNGDFNSSLVGRAQDLEAFVNKVKGAVSLVIVLGVGNMLLIIKMIS